MSLRLMQIVIPVDESDAVSAVLKDRPIVGIWRDAREKVQTIVHVLIDAKQAEPIMDELEHRFSGDEGFHVILLPIEAAVPRLPEPDEEERVALTEEEQKKIRLRVSREELYHEVTEGLGHPVLFTAMTILSAIVAAAGLLRNDLAVIIGAMVIAPLLAPNVALALATALGDVNLLRRALVRNLVGISLAGGIAILAGVILAVSPHVPAIASRTQVGVGDLILALTAGCAGTLAFTTGLPAALIGVMVAVALMPPLVVCGMLLGAGKYQLAGGAALLTFANVVCVNLAGVATFLQQGVGPRTWWEKENARKGTFRAIILWVLLLAMLAVVLYLSKDNLAKALEHQGL